MDDNIRALVTQLAEADAQLETLFDNLNTIGQASLALSALLSSIRDECDLAHQSAVKLARTTV